MSTLPDVLQGTWYPMPDDTIGGWCIMLSPHPPSEGRSHYVGEFLSEDVARYIADLHNAYRDDE